DPRDLLARRRVAPVPPQRDDPRMRAMLLDRPGQSLRLAEIPEPEPGPGEIKLAVRTCGVCRTDLHIYDAELQGEPKLPLVMGHQILGAGVSGGQGGGGGGGGGLGLASGASAWAPPGSAGPTAPAGTAARGARTSA